MKLTSESIGHTGKAAMLKTETDPSSFSSTDWQQNQSDDDLEGHIFPYDTVVTQVPFLWWKKLFQRFIASPNMWTLNF